MGFRKLEDDIPSGYKVTTPSDPYPVTIFNEEKSIPDNKIGKYLNKESLYYIDIYTNNKLFGNPFKSWLDMPQWLIQLHKMFNQLEIEYENYQLRQR